MGFWGENKVPIMFFFFFFFFGKRTIFVTLEKITHLDFQSDLKRKYRKN